MAELGAAGSPVGGTVHRLDGVVVREAGAGRTIFLLHGIGSSSRSFEAQLRELSVNHRVLAWDAPGYAASEDPPSAPGMAGYAAAAGQVLEALVDGPVDVIGVSWGGVIAVRLALDRPDLVRSLVLADSLVGSAADPSSAAAMRRRGADLEAVGPEAFAAQRSRRLLSPNASPELVAHVQASMAASIRQPGYGFAGEAMAETDHADLLHRITVPTLVLVGEQDVVTPLERSQVLVDNIPGARLETLPGAGHLSNQERPEIFNAAVLRFLREISDPPSITWSR